VDILCKEWLCYSQLLLSSGEGGVKPFVHYLMLTQSCYTTLMQTADIHSICEVVPFSKRLEVLFCTCGANITITALGFILWSTILQFLSHHPQSLLDFLLLAEKVLQVYLIRDFFNWKNCTESIHNPL
jgi:hypothetical protein